MKDNDFEMLNDAIAKLEEKFDKHLNEHKDTKSEKEELPVVWVDDYMFECPKCHRCEIKFELPRNRKKIQSKKGLIFNCQHCDKRFLIRTRPEPDIIPEEELAEGSRWQSVQEWTRPWVDGNSPSPPKIIEVEVRKLDYDELGLFTSDGKYLPVTAYLNWDHMEAAKHYSLHRTYAEALKVAAELWERDKTELECVVERTCEFSPLYINRKARFEKGKLQYKDSNYDWLPLHNNYAYLGPDHDLAEKICNEKNAEVAPEVDDSVLDWGIDKKHIIAVIQKPGCNAALLWAFKNAGCAGTYSHDYGTWRDLLEHSREWAQWAVDNLADHIDPKIIAALERKLGEGK